MNKETSNSEDIRAFCAFCGKSLIPNAEFCSYCGRSQLSNITGQTIESAVRNEAPKEILKVSKPSRINNILLILEIGFAALALLTASLLNLFKYKTSEEEIIFLNGAERSVISHDIAIYKLWIGGLIVTAILFLVSIICLVIRLIYMKRLGFVEIITALIVSFFFIVLNIPHWSKYDDMKADYDVVKLLDDKKSDDDFVIYSSVRNKERSAKKKQIDATPTPIPTPTPKPVLKRAVAYYSDPDHPSEIYEYDNQGRLIQYKFGDGDYNIINIEYEGDRLKSWNRPQYSMLEGEVSTNHEYFYNDKGLLIRESEENPTDDYKRILKDYTYNEKDQLIEVVWTIEHDYNVGDNVYVTTYNYDNYGQLISERTRKRRGENKEYNLIIVGEYISHETLTVNREVDYSYENGKLVKKETKIKYGEKKESERIEYEYNSAGKVSKITNESWFEPRPDAPQEYKIHQVTVSVFDDNGLLLSEYLYSDTDTDEYGFPRINYDSPEWKLFYKYYYE